MQIISTCPWYTPARMGGFDSTRSDRLIITMEKVLSQKNILRGKEPRTLS